MDFSGIIDYDLWLMPLLSGPHSPFADNLAILLTNGLTWIPLYIVMVFIVIRNNETIPQIALVLGCVALCMILTNGMDAGLVKPLVHRIRPLNDPAVRPLLTLVVGVGDDGYSFFSAHASNTMALAAFMALLLRNVWAAIALFCWSMINCWTRIYLCMHYPSDIAVGLVWGLAVGCLVFMLFIKIYRKVSPQLHFISSAYSRSGYAYIDIFLMINVLLLTIMTCIFCSLWLIR